MSLKRRNFLRSAGTLTLGRLAGLGSGKDNRNGSDESAHIGIGGSRRKIRIAVLVQEGFPTRDAKPVNKSFLDKLLEPFDRKDFTIQTAAEVLRPDTVDLFFHPYGSAFPEAINTPFKEYLTGGGNWMQLGGIPLSYPARLEKEKWTLPGERGKIPSWLPFIDPMETNGRLIRKWKLSKNISGLVTPPVLKKGLLWHMHLQEQFAGQAVVRPLLSGMDRDGANNVRPIQVFDWNDGPYKGGRWIVASCSSYFPPEEIHSLIKLTAFGPVQLEAKQLTVERRKVIQAELYSPDGTIGQYLPAKATIRMWNVSASQTAYLGDAFMALRGDRASAVFSIPRNIDMNSPATAEVSFELDRTPLGRLTSRITLDNA